MDFMENGCVFWVASLPGRATISRSSRENVHPTTECSELLLPVCHPRCGLPCHLFAGQHFCWRKEASTSCLSLSGAKVINPSEHFLTPRRPVRQADYVCRPDRLPWLVVLCLVATVLSEDDGHQGSMAAGLDNLEGLTWSLGGEEGCLMLFYMGQL